MERTERIRHVRLLRGGLALVLASALAGCGAGESASGDITPGPAANAAAHVVMTDDTFQSGDVNVTAGTQVVIEVRNDGKSNHNFTIDSMNISTGPMHTGDVMSVRLTAPKGTTQFHCTWHPGMVAQIVAA